MKIKLDNISKKFNQEVIFKNLSYSFNIGEDYAIIGANGSGKSTLLQVLSGYTRPSSGQITYNIGDFTVDDIYNEISIAAPYLELIEEFTLSELIDFHLKFKESKFSKNEIIKKAYLESAKLKQIKKFSSGMKQRLKLALTFYTKSSVLLLDEPTSNLDLRGIEWFQDNMNILNKNNDKIILIASNQEYEYKYFENTLNIEEYKIRI